MNNFRNITYFVEGFQLHIFNGLASFSISDLEAFVSEVCKSEHPTEVFIYYSGRYSLDLGRVSPKIRTKVFQRLKCHPKIIIYDAGGYRGLDEKYDKGISDEGVIKSLKKCLSGIVERRAPVIKAPLGRLFTKPSGSKSTYFIQAARILCDPTEITLIALLLLDLLGDKLSEDVDTIWVDTIDVFPLILTALKIKFPDPKNYPFIESFSSYSNFSKAMQKGFSEACLVLISASTSDNLRKAIRVDSPMIPDDCIYTLLTDKKTSEESLERGGKFVLSVVSTPEEKFGELMPSTRIYGERFALDLLPPKKITLLKKEHSLTSRDRSRLGSLIDNEVFHGYGVGVNSEKHPIFVDAEKLIAQESFDRWYKQTLQWQLRSSTTHVIYIDEAARKLAQLCKISLPKVKIISFSELYKDTEKIKAAGAILVVASVISHGAKLGEVSKLLRELPSIGPITYIAGVCTPPTVKSYSSLSKSLSMSPEYPEFCYTVHSYLVLQTGDVDEMNSSWQKEIALLESNQSEEFFDERLAKRLADLHKKRLSSNEVFFESEKLDFTEGFVFWNGGYKVNKEHSCADASALVATVMKILQNARENRKLPDELRLSSKLSEQVLLSPENFYRFNDPLIQAAMLRSAASCEMNYSEDEESSLSVSYMIRRSLSLENSVLYESLLALSSKRLRLTQKQLKLLHDDLSEVESRDSVLSLFLPEINKLLSS